MYFSLQYSVMDRAILTPYRRSLRADHGGMQAWTAWVDGDRSCDGLRRGVNDSAFTCCQALDDIRETGRCKAETVELECLRYKIRCERLDQKFNPRTMHEKETLRAE